MTTSKKPFVRAEEGLSNSVIYYDEDGNKTIRSLNEDEYERLLDAMKKHEGWREGKEEYIEVKKVLGVHFNKKRVISEFLVGNDLTSSWILKSEAIVLAELGLSSN